MYILALLYCVYLHLVDLLRNYVSNFGPVSGALSRHPLVLESDSECLTRASSENREQRRRSALLSHRLVLVGDTERPEYCGGRALDISR